jgi:hypothetical protein
VTALAAAAAVLVVIAGAITVARTISRGAPSASAAASLYFGIPRYYTYPVQGNAAQYTDHGVPTSDTVDARPGPMIAWSNASGSRLIVEMPRGSRTTVGYLTGGKFTPLPHVALAPLLSAMNTSGFSDSGGYTGLAW